MSELLEEMDKFKADVCVCVLQEIGWPGKGTVVEI